MITASPDFELGRDKTRMKDPADAERQHATVARLLERMFAADPDERWEIQLVADEVGMGKTFVALATAFSVLQAVKNDSGGDALAGVQPTVLVIAPSRTLLMKWEREVSEFLRRCMPEHDAASAKEWFRPTVVDRADELAAMLRGTRPHGGVVLTYMDVLTGNRKLQHYDVKRRFILGALFHFWASSFPADAQARLLKGAPEGWPRRPEELVALTDAERAVLPFASLKDACGALVTLKKHDPSAAAELQELLDICTELSQPHTRDRAEKFEQVIKKLASIYRAACFAGIRSAVPLVIVDEAHNWKNGPQHGSNGYRGFERWLGPLCRRAMLLTATPFQLRPEEMLELLRIGECLQLDPDPAVAAARRKRLEQHRTKVIALVLAGAADQSRAFARAWARVGAGRMGALRELWTSDELARTRKELRSLAHREGVVDRVALERVISATVAAADAELREILREALRLYVLNEDLSQELGAYVIRHRRRVEHRLFQIGAEFGDVPPALLARNDRFVLHAADGIDVRGEAELPHYILMRCVSEMKNGKGRSSLGSALTGCYSTLLHSADGKALQTKLKAGAGASYFELLTQMVDASKDAEHPKVRAVVDAVVDAWRAGEKTLIFCFRTHTARQLHKILQERIEAELTERRVAIVGSSSSLENLRARFTRKDEDLVLLGLDRVLWSLLWAARSDEIALPHVEPEDLQLRDAELPLLAELALSHGVELRGETIDRVFIHRAVEHLIANRMLAHAKSSGGLFKQVLRHLADIKWVRFPYGLELDHDNEGTSYDEVKGLDSRGVHTVYSPVPNRADVRAVEELAQALLERRERGRRSGAISVFDTYAHAPSFWLGPDPGKALAGEQTIRGVRTLATLHSQLLLLTRAGAQLDWKERLLMFQALRHAVLRDSILVRLLPERAEVDKHGWAEVLVRALYEPMRGQQETMADRLGVFAEDMQAASGKITGESSMRRSLYEGTRLRGEGQVVLVDGSTDSNRRERVFAGFNSPLLPEVLICTQVGQEGIDLHRHCRRVVHYDLAWNPAVVEQRTGRVDRIGSKTFRERSLIDLLTSSAGHLSVGVPYLAGTYDERMYEELRIRSQIFEVLTGGDVSADNLEGSDESDAAEGEDTGLTFPVLPQEMIGDLRVRLHVWDAPP